MVPVSRLEVGLHRHLREHPRRASACLRRRAPEESHL